MSRHHPPIRAFTDDELARMQTHPDEFVFLTAMTFTVKDWNEWKQQKAEKFEKDAAAAHRKWSEPLDIEIKLTQDWGDPDGSRVVTVNGDRWLNILAHRDGEYGVYRWIHESAIHCAPSYDEAVEWAKQFCLNAVKTISSLLWVCEYAQFATTPIWHSPTKPLAQHAKDTLTSIKGQSRSTPENDRLGEMFISAYRETEARVKADEQPKRIPWWTRLKRAMA